MLFKRTTLALALAAALLAVTPTAPASPAALGVPWTPSAPVVVGLPETSVQGPAAASSSWALVSWGIRTSSLHLAPWQEVTVSFGISIGCGFIGAGVGLANPVAGIFVGAGCGSGIGA